MNKKKKPGFFYGWVIAVCCMLSVCGASLLSTGMSTNLAAMRSVLGLSGTQTSMILTVRSISAFVVALFAGKYYDYLGVKKGMIAAMLAGGLSFLLFASAGTNMALNYIAGAVAGITYSYGMMMPASMLIKNWFNKSRGIALSIASCGTGLVSIIFAPLVQTMVDRFGIKSAFYMQAGVLVLIAVILTVFVIPMPSALGMEPLGEETWPDKLPEEAKKQTTSLSKGWFIALVAATVLVGASASPSSAHFTLNFTTEGLDAMQVAKALSVYGFVLIASKIILGKAVDKIGTFRTTMIFEIICIIGMAMLFMTRFFPNVTWMNVTMVVVGTGVVIQTLGYPNWVADLDSAHYNHTLEKCQMGYQLGALVASPLPGLIADATGSYTWAYLGFTVITVIITVIIFAAYTAASAKAKAQK